MKKKKENKKEEPCFTLSGRIDIKKRSSDLKKEKKKKKAKVWMQMQCYPHKLTNFYLPYWIEIPCRYATPQEEIEVQ